MISKSKAKGLVPCTDNAVVLFDKSDPMNPFHDPAGLSRLDDEKNTVREMIQTIPASLNPNAALRLFSAERVGTDEATWLIYRLMPLKKEEFQKTLYRDRVCIDPVQLGKNPTGKKLAEQIVADAKCGFVENADNLQTPAAGREALKPDVPGKMKPRAKS